MFREHVSNRKPFGLETNAVLSPAPSTREPIKVYRRGGHGWCAPSRIVKNIDLVNRWKVIIPAARGESALPTHVLGAPFLSEPGSCCSGTYLVVYVGERKECVNAAHYLTTRFARFMVRHVKQTLQSARQVYRLLPDQDYSIRWTDEMLYEKYGLSEEEIAYIESTIKERRFSV